jgi:fido (protein-threonine AMPylation protein)
VASVPPPDWDADSQILRSNLARVEDGIRADVKSRTKPSLAAARAWHVAMMKGLKVRNPLFVGRFRGEAGLEDIGVRVGRLEGTHPDLVAGELKEFERRLQSTVAALDARYPIPDSLDLDGMDAVIELAAWAHSEWVRIHPFSNGNGRSARIWANLLLMRYGMRPVLRLRPRPITPYEHAGHAGMQGDSAPMAVLIRSLHDASFAGQPIQAKKVTKKGEK